MKKRRTVVRTSVISKNDDDDNDEADDDDDEVCSVHSMFVKLLVMILIRVFFLFSFRISCLDRTQKVVLLVLVLIAKHLSVVATFDKRVI